jgi:methionyl aminopeptidase
MFSNSHNAIFSHPKQKIVHAKNKNLLLLPFMLSLYNQGMPADRNIRLKSEYEIEKIAEAGHLIAIFYQQLEQIVKPGMSSMDIEILAEEHARKHKVIPVFKNVDGYHHCTCVSINNEVVHGIPNKKRIIKDGDLVKIDYGLQKDGFIGDSAITIPVGKVSKKAKKLVDVTRKCLELGIAAAKIGNTIGDIGHAIQGYAQKHKYGVVRQFVGHGVGYELHEAPEVPHYGLPNTGLPLREGMVIAIEPMINEKTYRCVIQDDGWTAVTADGKLSAQFEHTIAITKKGPRILTI